MISKFKNITLFVSLIIILCISNTASAGLSDLLSKAKGWWGERSVNTISIISEGEDPEPDDDGGDGEGEEEDEEGEDEGEDESTGKGGGGQPGMCKVPQQPAVMICEIGSGFICVSTPQGGVDADEVFIKGTMDRKGSVIASIRIAAQNEYTKKTAFVDTSNPSSSGCWDEVKGERPFCLDSEGRFSAIVPLTEKGPHTISVSASRLSGESVEKKVRTSRVVAPALSDDKVVFNPDVTKITKIDETMVMVTIDLLGDCTFCDFIGASTGGITASVENMMVDFSGADRRITCETTVEQGGQGRFVIGVPAYPGKNELTISICNDAVEGACPKIEGISFEAGGDLTSLNTISPPPQPSYDSSEYPTIEWKFTLGGDASCVNLQFNREAPREVCADSSGTFSAELNPRVGINLATLSIGDNPDEFAWSFGWGRIESPFEDVEGQIEVSNAAGIFLSKHMLGDILFPLINNFIASDEFDTLLLKMLAGEMNPQTDDEDDMSKDEDVDAEGPTIPKCDAAGGGTGGSIIKIDGVPEIDGISLSDFSLDKGKMNLSAILDGVTVGILYAPDKDGDGKADKSPLPLKIAFRKAIANFEIVQSETKEGDPLILISSPHTDCAYKDSDYCKHMSAALIPKNFVGDATPWGGFVRCEVAQAADDVKDACKAFNSLNAQTGIVSEVVLDAINSLIYCKGSGMATRFTYDYMDFPIAFGCAGDEPCEDMISNLMPAMVLPLGIKLEDGIDISSKGILLDIGVSAGSHEFFENTPEVYRIPTAGLVIKDDSSSDGISASGAAGYDLGVSFSLDALNAIFYTGIAHGDGNDSKGLLDFDISEPFFNSIGYDFVKECDEFDPNAPGVKTDKIPTICLIRPRVMELLGATLTTYGYFPQKQPLLMAIRGNRALSPRIAVTTADEMPVVQRSSDSPIGGGAVYDPPTGTVIEIALGGLQLSFYALEVDESVEVDKYENFPIKMDADDKPVIHSMRPENPNPWEGQIVSFDFSLLLGMEIMDIEPDSEDDSKSVMKIRTLADRSRLLITPIEGSNVTTIPSRRMISSLAEQFMAAIAQFSQIESAIPIPIPSEMKFESGGSDSVFNSLGLRRISFGEDGLSLNFDHEKNMISFAIQAVIEQVLHIDGEEREFVYP